jgi:hypothetical protein
VRRHDQHGGSVRRMLVRDVSGFKWGVLALTGGAEKPQRHTDQYNYIFCVLRGRTCLTIGDEYNVLLTEVALAEGSTAQVPRGNYYSLKGKPMPLSRQDTTSTERVAQSVLPLPRKEEQHVGVGKPTTTEGGTEDMGDDESAGCPQLKRQQTIQDGCGELRRNWSSIVTFVRCITGRNFSQAYSTFTLVYFPPSPPRPPPPLPPYPSSPLPFSLHSPTAP